MDGHIPPKEMMLPSYFGFIYYYCEIYFVFAHIDVYGFAFHKSHTNDSLMDYRSLNDGPSRISKRKIYLAAKILVQ